jgi:hypothetical protein
LKDTTPIKTIDLLAMNIGRTHSPTELTNVGELLGVVVGLLEGRAIVVGSNTGDSDGITVGIVVGVKLGVSVGSRVGDGVTGFFEGDKAFTRILIMNKKLKEINIFRLTKVGGELGFAVG